MEIADLGAFAIMPSYLNMETDPFFFFWSLFLKTLVYMRTYIAAAGISMDVHSPSWYSPPGGPRWCPPGAFPRQTHPHICTPPSPTPVPDTCTQPCMATRLESHLATCLSSFLLSSPLLPAGKELKPWFTTSIDSPCLPSSHMPAQLPSVITTLISQRLSPWDTRGTHGALRSHPYREEAVQRFSGVWKVPQDKAACWICPRSHSFSLREWCSRRATSSSSTVLCLWGWFLPQH